MRDEFSTKTSRNSLKKRAYSIRYKLAAKATRRQTMHAAVKRTVSRLAHVYIHIIHIYITVRSGMGCTLQSNTENGEGLKKLSAAGIIKRKGWRSEEGKEAQREGECVRACVTTRGCRGRRRGRGRGRVVYTRRGESKDDDRDARPRWKWRWCPVVVRNISGQRRDVCVSGWKS